MSRLVDADELLKETNIWCDCVDGACLLKNAPTVKAIPLDVIISCKQELITKIIEYSGSGNEVTQAYCDGFKDSLKIIDKLIESEDTEKRKPCINYEDGCEEWAGCPCVHYNAESEEK